jgi:antirestriction protein ArdC
LRDGGARVPEAFCGGFCRVIRGRLGPEVPELETLRERVLRVIDRFFAATGLEIRHGGNRAYYSVTDDRIQMPPFESFRDAESYYSTLGHEAVHSTRHSSRLDRSFGRERWGDEGYARKELVAELGSAFLSADLELALEPREDHAAYIESWLKVLSNDKRAIFSAAAAPFLLLFIAT